MHNAFEYGCMAPLPPPLRSEDQIIATWQSMGKPVVSILCATYNHALYLKDALHGLLAQETSFPFEIIIRDDASIDGTAEIVREYAAMFPRIIRTIFEPENQYSKGARPNSAMVPYARGEFIALCEGDDYWITSDKLEKQVELLRGCSNCSMCVAQTVACKYQGSSLVCDQIFASDKDCLNFEDVKQSYVHTSTYLIRTDSYTKAIAQYARKIGFSDSALRYILADMGPFIQLKEIVSVYRQTGAGLWTSLERMEQVEWEIELAESFLDNFKREYRPYFSEKLYRLYGLMISGRVFTFNNRGPIKNLCRFFYFALKHRAHGIYLKILSFKRTQG